MTSSMSILKKTIDTIASESPNFRDSFKCVKDLVSEIGEANLANTLYSSIDQSVPWRIIADLLGILIWCTSDNGHSLVKATERWILDCDDPRKIKIACSLDVYPFLTADEMNTNLQRASEKFPELGTMLDDLIRQRSCGNAS